jgi:hypothetical protein
MTSKLKAVVTQTKTILSTEVSEALKQAGEAVYNSDQAVGLSKRANKNAALLLKKEKCIRTDCRVVTSKKIQTIRSGLR